MKTRNVLLGSVGIHIPVHQIHGPHIAHPGFRRLRRVPINAYLLWDRNEGLQRTRNIEGDVGHGIDDVNSRKIALVGSRPNRAHRPRIDQLDTDQRTATTESNRSSSYGLDPEFLGDDGDRPFGAGIRQHRRSRNDSNVANRREAADQVSMDAGTQKLDFRIEAEHLEWEHGN